MSERDIGLVGLGTMGAALALNIAEKGFGVAVWNRTGERTTEFMDEAGPLAANITPAATLEELVAAIRPPRAVLLMVPAGDPVDQQIAALTPLLSDGDLIIDGGNANFHDTERRNAETGGIGFFGIGVSGGEEGARHGPAIMAGGEPSLWQRIEPILKAIAADYEGEPCADWFGPGGAGHFVKTVHNGIEYADMQMIAEVYGILRDGMGKGSDEIGTVFERWNAGRLQSYLIEISGIVAKTADTASGGPILDVIVDAAGQKGTGRWTAIEAQHLAAPVTVIEAAVAARNVSSRRTARAEAEDLFGTGPEPLSSLTVDDLEAALTAGKILCYSQGFGMLAAASDRHGWNMNLPAVARVWRAGCIIRSGMLDDMAAALAEDPGRALMMAPFFADILKDTHGSLRKVVAEAARHGIAVPALSAGLAYFDGMRTARGTANMIQGQRDYFGRHGFARLDDGTEGRHGPWAD
ncbi:NADP-dependent phosphogluconate dehydrogenase [Rhodobacterales bacterium HKCCE2091]|nr:NADP-dependent phosphogluconate dehydrogenase [Rhodobacterales bacterium HKCCE2091]